MARAAVVMEMLAVLALLATSGCREERETTAPRVPEQAASMRDRPENEPLERGMKTPAPGWEKPEVALYRHAWKRMIDDDLRGRDIQPPRILEAMSRVPRHEFVPAEYRDAAYEDGPLPIGEGQTISQPYIVALMTQLARPRPEDRALDIGTGSGYQAAVLAELVKEVYSIEIVPSLADVARDRLQRLGYANIHVRCGDGYQGWKEQAPFDIIIVAAAPQHIPQPLIDQLAPGGRLILPIGGYSQELVLIEKQDDGTTRTTRIAGVAFVPMTGEAQRRRGSRSAPP